MLRRAPGVVNAGLRRRCYPGEMMFSRLFRNRYAALLWAAGVLWFALDVADKLSRLR